MSRGLQNIFLTRLTSEVATLDRVSFENTLGEPKSEISSKRVESMKESIKGSVIVVVVFEKEWKKGRTTGGHNIFSFLITIFKISNFEFRIQFELNLNEFETQNSKL